MKNLTHTLITFPITPRIHMHGYLMCPKEKAREQLNALIEQMADHIEQSMPKGMFMMPIVLSTTLDKAAIKTVLNIMKRFPEIAEMHAKATTHHHAAWVMTSDNPDDEILMDLH